MEDISQKEFIRIYQPEGCVELYVGVREDGTAEYLHYVNGILCSWEEIRELNKEINEQVLSRME